VVEEVDLVSAVIINEVRNAPRCFEVFDSISLQGELKGVLSATQKGINE